MPVILCTAQHIALNGGSLVWVCISLSTVGRVNLGCVLVSSAWCAAALWPPASARADAPAAAPVRRRSILWWSHVVTDVPGAGLGKSKIFCERMCAAHSSPSDPTHSPSPQSQHPPPPEGLTAHPVSQLSTPSGSGSAFPGALRVIQYYFSSAIEIRGT